MSDVPEDIHASSNAIIAKNFGDGYFDPTLWEDIASAILAERERCAKIAEEVGRGASRNREIYIMTGVAGLSRVIASAIRLTTLPHQEGA